MKRLLLSLVFLLVIFTLCFKTTSEVNAETNDGYLYDGLAEGETVVDFYTETVPVDDLYDGLAEGETVVDFYREIVPVNEEENKLVDNFDQESEITPFARSKRWFAVSKTYIGLHRGNWKYAGASTVSGGVLSASHTKTVSHTYTGSLAVTRKALTSYIGFDIGKSWSRSVSYSSPFYPSGNYRLEYRHVYKNYQVKQEQKYDSRGKVYATKYVYPKEWVERQYRVVQF